jgi:hypothetical protein
MSLIKGLCVFHLNIVNKIITPKNKYVCTIASDKITNLLALWFADRQRDIIKSEIKNARAWFSAVVAASASVGSCNLSSHL